METAFGTLRLRPIIHCDGCEPAPDMWLYDVGCTFESVEVTHTRRIGGMNLRDRNGNRIDSTTSLLEYFCLNGSDIWCRFSYPEEADAYKKEAERALNGDRPVLFYRSREDGITSHLLPEPRFSVYFEKHQYMARYIQYMLEQKGYGLRKVVLRLWDFSIPPEDLTVVDSRSDTGLGMLLTFEEPEDMEIQVSEGIKLSIDGSHFKSIKNGLGLSHTAVDELRTFVDTLDPRSDADASSDHLTSSQLWNRVNNDLTTIRTRLPPGSARRLRELLSPANAAPHHAQQPQQAPQTIFGTFLQLWRQIDAWVRARFNAIAGIEWLGICVFAFCFELLKITSHHNTFYGSVVVWTFVSVKVILCELKRMRLFDAEQYFLAHVFPIVYSVEAVDGHSAQLRQAAADEIEGTPPKYDLILNNLIIRPYIYQQVAICVAAILPWILRSWKTHVDRRREEVLKLVKTRIAEEKDKLIAESKRAASESEQPPPDDAMEIE